MKAIVFDIGNVLVRWVPQRAFEPALGSTATADEFMVRVDFLVRNLRADQGERFSDMALEIVDPTDRAIFAAYVENFPNTVSEAIEGSWALMDRLRAKGFQIHAITNWSAETWPAGVAAHARLGTSFGVTVVSGVERVMKPAPAIFALLCERAGLDPIDCFFIDDSEKNVSGARAFGMEAHHFTTPDALEADLTARGWI